MIRPSASQLAYAVLALGVVVSAPASAQSVPTIDTEDATLGSHDVGTGRIHPVLGLDVRNGDFARGDYDDDRADLDRLPVHAQIGLGAELHHDSEGKADTWLVVSSSNGFHSPAAYETTSPRAWYESNNLLAVVATPVRNLRAALVYTIKTSPNGVSDTTNEVSASFAYDAKHGIGALRPTFVATTRTKGSGGGYAQIAIGPRIALGQGESAASLIIPATVGFGFGGFYGTSSRDRLFASAGLGLTKSFTIGGAHLSANGRLLALVRDDRLARLSGPRGETGTVVPLATFGVSSAW